MPGKLVKFTFLGPNVNRQTAFVNVNEYRSFYELYRQAVPVTEIRELDWYKVIVPQFLSDEIMAKTRDLQPFKSSDMDSIGLRLERYETVY